MDELSTIPSRCCAPEAQESCCEPAVKETCCATDHPSGCGCERPPVAGAEDHGTVRTG